MSDALEVKQVRGHIVSAMGSFYPNGMSGRMIFEEVVQPIFPTVEWDGLMQEVTYLKQRGFVEIVGDLGERNASARRKFYRLTAVGYDLATGVSTDDAIARVV